jgi:hypothetical protein
MLTTRPRTDLPQVGDEIATVHGCGQWYSARPQIVVQVDPDPPRPTAARVVTKYWEFEFRLHTDEQRTRPDIMFESFTVFDASYPLAWNLVTDLSDAERKPIDAFRERVAGCKHIYEPRPVAESPA